MASYDAGFLFAYWIELVTGFHKKKPRSKILAFFIKADNYAVVSIMVPLFASIAVGAFGAGAFAFTD